MPIIDLNEAINEIKNILDDVENSPFFLMVGAGVSIPNIPSAQSIIEICRKKLNITKKDTINYACEYSEILSKAFPSPELRRRFLESIIVNTKITDSNVELADILLSKKLTNTLFTTNFDNQIERAISLLGGDNIITSDNNESNMLIDVDPKKIQIIYLHGKYNNYKCKNLIDEINKRDNSEFSMDKLLSHYLRNKSPIIMGYSGIYDDIFMESIQKRLKNDVPFNYYWFCYSKEDYEKLPNWLKNNKQVKFILPKIDDVYRELNIFYFNDKNIEFDKMPSSIILKKLIKKLNIKQPEIFTNPFFMLDRMMEQINLDMDIYRLKNFADEINEIKNYYNNSKESISELYKNYREGEYWNLLKNIKIILSNNYVITNSQLDDINYNILKDTFELLENKSAIKSDYANFMVNMPFYRKTVSSYIMSLRGLVYKIQFNKKIPKSKILEILRSYDGIESDDFMPTKCIFLNIKFYLISA